MTDEDALLAAILADPGDDLPRLVYADWLEEHGQRERAEFIRVQAAAPDKFSNIPDRALPDWFGGPIDGAYPSAYTVRAAFDTDRGPLAVLFNRGFLTALRGPLAAFWGERECDSCCGHGDTDMLMTVQPPAGASVCRYCHGTGRVSGPTPALVGLVGREPVERVEATDVTIHRGELFDGAGQRYGLVADTWGHGRTRLPRGHVLPKGLWDRVVAPTHPFDRLQKVFESAGEGESAVSAAILSAAREWAARPEGEL